MQRRDDNPDTIKERLVVYEKQTKPLAEYYDKSGVVAKIDGAVSPDKVFEQIENFSVARKRIVKTLDTEGVLC